jgi:hypothetical protein
LAGAGAARADNIMRVCGNLWQKAKADGTTHGMTWKDFEAKCREEQKNNPPHPESAPEATTQAAPAAAPAATPAPSASGGTGKSAKDCNAEYGANKDAIKSSGQKKKDFIAACRAGTETVPSGGGSASATSEPAESSPQPSAPAAQPSGAGQFTAEAEAKGKCPNDTVVWVNTKSSVYHFAGARSYGKTKKGAYMCEADAKAAGDRAAAKEKHP